MINPFERAGFIFQENNYQDLEIYEKDSIALVVMKKFKDDKKAFRQAGNHIDERLVAELMDIFNTYENREDIKALILTSGHKVAFCRGAKVELMLDLDNSRCRLFIEKAQNLVMKIMNFPKPVIAAINGLTFGGGFEMAMACDYRISSDRENVFFGLPEASLGIIPGMGGTTNLYRIAGREIAKDIIYNARVDIDPNKALELALIDKVVSYDKLIEESLKMALEKNLKKVFVLSEGTVQPDPETVQEEIKNYIEKCEVKVIPGEKVAPLAKALLDFLFEKSQFDDFEKGLLYEKEINCFLQNTEDCKEGIKAMIEEREPVFKGK